MMRATHPRVDSRANRVLAAAVVAVLMLSGCSGQRFPTRHPMGIPLRSKSRFEKERNLYKDIQAAHKSLALAGEPDKVFVLGYSSSKATSAEEAIAEALADCDQRRRDRRIESPCRIIPVDDARQP